jgi:predicted DNA-binding ArsR family transcriptional regulator
MINGCFIQNIKEWAYTVTTKIKKPVNGEKEEFVYHTYWTVKGVNFLDDLLYSLGYKQQGEQLNLF